MLESELAERCRSFVADKGLDTDALRKILYRGGVTTAINVRRMWREVAVEGFRHPTRSLYEHRVDTMFHDEVGKQYCKCPQTGKVRQMSYYGLERKRGTQKCHCPALVRGVPGVRSAIDSVALAKIQNGAAYASRLTRTSFAPLRRCRGTPIDGNGCTRNAVHWSVSLAGSVTTFSWSSTICEDLKPCRYGLP